jgi:hypothetical protein
VPHPSPFETVRCQQKNEQTASVQTRRFFHG